MTTPEGRTGAAGTSRARLLDTAEGLFARYGLEAVSLRQIGREAGQRNTGAVRYHFGDLDSVVDAILARHTPQVDSVREALLDQIELTGTTDLRSFAAALVQPLGSKLEDDSGRCYLAVAAQLVNRPGEDGVARVAAGEGNSLLRWRALVEPHLPEGATALHARFNAIQFAYTEMARRAQRDPAPRSRLLAISRVTDITASILATPLTPETGRLLSEVRSVEDEPLS